MSTVKLWPWSKACHFFLPRNALNVSVVASVAARGIYPPDNILPYTAISGYSCIMLEALDGPRRYIPTATYCVTCHTKRYWDRFNMIIRKRGRQRSINDNSMWSGLCLFYDLWYMKGYAHLIINDRNSSRSALNYEHFLIQRINEFKTSRSQHQRF